MYSIDFHKYNHDKDKSNCDKYNYDKYNYDKCNYDKLHTISNWYRAMRCEQ